MRHPERRRRERALPRAARTPLLTQYAPGLSAVAVSVGRVGFDELEGIAGRRPVIQRAGLEIEIERAAVRLGRHALRRHARRVRDVEAALHARGAVAGQRAEVGVALRRLERDAGGRAFVEDLRALDVLLLERDVVHHQLAVDDGDADGLARDAPRASDCGCRRSRRRRRDTRAWSPPACTRGRSTVLRGARGYRRGETAEPPDGRRQEWDAA